VAPSGLLAEMRPGIGEEAERYSTGEDRDAVERLAMATVMAAETALGRQPRDVSAQRGLGYDIESKDPATGSLVFVEVKGRWQAKDMVTLTKNEILCARNEPERFRLALVVVDEAGARAPRYVREMDFGEPGFAETQRTFRLSELLAVAGEPV
jgi:hypothetical protein